MQAPALRDPHGVLARGHTRRAALAAARLASAAAPCGGEQRDHDGREGRRPPERQAAASALAAALSTDWSRPGKRSSISALRSQVNLRVPSSRSARMPALLRVLR